MRWSIACRSFSRYSCCSRTGNKSAKISTLNAKYVDAIRISLEVVSVLLLLLLLLCMCCNNRHTNYRSIDRRYSRLHTASTQCVTMMACVFAFRFDFAKRHDSATFYAACVWLCLHRDEHKTLRDRLIFISCIHWRANRYLGVRVCGYRSAHE